MPSQRRRALVALAGSALLAVMVVLSTPAGAATSGLALAGDETWQTNGRVTALLTIGHTTYLGGTFTSVRPAGRPAGSEEAPRARLAAVDAVTGALLPWDPGADSDVLALAASRDGGTVYAGGTFSTIGGQPRLHVAALSAATGAPEPFAASIPGRVAALATSGTRLYIGGAFSAVSGARRSNLAAVDRAGTVDPDWHPAANAMVRAISVSPRDAAVYVGGEFTTIDGNTKQRKLAKLSPTTGAVLPFAQRPGYPVWSVVATADSVYVGGDGAGGHISRFTPTGSSVWVVQTDGGVQAVRPFGGVLYAGGHFNKVCLGNSSGPTTGFQCPTSRAERRKLLAVDALTGTVDPWAPPANSPLGVFALTSGSARLQVGGDFSAIGAPSRARQGFAQFGRPGVSPRVLDQEIPAVR